MSRLSLIIILILTLKSSFTYAQNYTIDYLNYSEQIQDAHFSARKLKITSSVFAKKTREFDESSIIATYKSIAMYSYFAGRLYNWDALNINIAFQIGTAIGSDGSVGVWWGTPWIWTNVKPHSNIPIWMCIGYQFAKIGSEIGEGDNKTNIGLLTMFKIGPITNNASIHYRMRGKTEKSVVDYLNRVEQLGNEIHYKFEPSKKIANNKQLSVFTMGYYGHNRKIDEEIISNSRSYEVTFGSSYTNFLKNNKILVLSFLTDIHVSSLADIHSRYMGFAFLFNVIW